MVSAPVNVYTARTANQPAKIRVYLGPSDGSASDFTESFDLIPIEISLSAGARPDYAIFEYKTDRLTEIVDATETVTGNRDEISFNRQVYVTVEDRHALATVDADPNATTRRTLFWGELLTETLHIDPVSQRITIAARVAPYHFGDLLEGEHHWDANTGASALVPVDPVFNPLIDGIIEGNLPEAFVISTGDLNGLPFRDASNRLLWIDPDAVRTDEAKETARGSSDIGLTGTLWELNEAVSALADWTIGNTEEFLSRPDTDNTAGSIWADQPAIKNLRVPRGRHLNEILDLVLIPHGYAWYLDHSGFDALLAPGDLPEIIVFRRGEGINRSAKLQATGEDLDLAKSTAIQIDLSTDVGNLANTLYGWGSFEEKELTIELYRGWLEADDDLEAEDLRKSEDTSAYNVSNKKNVWRLWPGNEAGDYTDTRTTTQPITSYLDLSTVFDTAVPTRRRLEDCLTKDAQGKRRPPYLEWSDDNGATWQEVPPEWGWVVLPDQIGILFTGDVPPEDLIAAGDEAKLRITGTIISDTRLSKSVSSIVNDSPTLRAVPLFLDLSDRYHKRSVQSTGSLASVLSGDANGADTVDDETALETYLDAMMATELSAEMRSAFRLHGIQTDYEISDLIVSVDGRDVFLNRNKYNPSDKGEKKYPQIYGVRWLFQEQVTELMMEDVG